ncbi:unnamed protein product [Rotaria sp. Silwood1]|nr:unnamed protein product [Rotaria sp. Silwood1]CAF5021185.1 unnamed protein product [Rotaria sp. Silwood1]
MKQHMPNKPHRWGYKMFLLAGGESGICYHFLFYVGKSDFDTQEQGFCTKVVLELCETVPLELNKLGIYSVGTVRADRLLGLIVKDEKDLSKEGKESMDHRVAGVDGVELCAVRWYDNKTDNCLSTLYGCQPTDLVERWSSKEKNHIQIAQPNIVKAYNQYMGGVDLIDMLISLYRINGRSKKYYTKIIFHLIDLSIVNGWLLYCRHCSQLNIQKRGTMSLLLFRISVAEAMLKSAPPTPSTKRGRPSLDSTSNENNQTTTSRAVPNSIPPSSVRLDKFDHWSIHASKSRCRNFDCIGYTRICCSKCQLYVFA